MPNKLKADISRALSVMGREEYPERVENENSNRHKELHPSSFNFCPVETFYKLASHGLFNHRWESASFLFYVDVGTVVHSVMQKFMGRQFHVVGDWKCKRCGDTKKFSTFEEAGLCCGHKRHYEELGIKFRKTIRGHTDGLFKHNNKFWLIDYKTSSIKSIAKHLDTGKEFPYKSNREQIRSYLPLLEKEYNIKIEGWALIYLARDNPFTTAGHFIVTEVCTEELRKTYQKRMVRYDKQYDTMLDVEGSGEELDYLINTKPCACEADYEELFASDYDECPLKKICLSKDHSKLISKMNRLADSSKFLPIRIQKMQDGIPPQPEKKKWVPSGNYIPPKITEF